MAKPSTKSRLLASTAVAKAAPTKTLGTSRSSMNDGAGIYDAPDNFLNLTGTARFDAYDRMVRDTTIIAAGVRLFLNLMANAVWTVNPPEDLNANEEPVAQGYADAAYDALFGMTSSWSNVVRKIATYRLHGFSIMEWTAKRLPDGTIGLLDIEHRPQRTIIRWKRDESGTVEEVIQRVSGRSEVTLPRSKIVYAVDDMLTDSPEGLGLFRHLVETAHRLRVYLDLEDTGFTTDLRGIPVARVPLTELREMVEAAGPIGTPERDAAETMRTAMVHPMRDFLDKHVRNKNTGVLLPSETFEGLTADKTTTPSSTRKWELELLTGDSTSFSDMAEAIKRMNMEMARILGVEHLMLGGDGSGSFALAKSKIGTFYQTVTATLLDLVEVIDRDILDPLSELNGWPEELRPQMGVNEISDRDIEQLLTGLSQLATAGAPVMPDDPAVGEIYDLWGLTRPPERGDVNDLSLNPNRKTPNKNPADPNAPMDTNPEDAIAKRRVIKSRRKRMRR